MLSGTRVLDLAFDVGATYRLTRLVTRDALLAGPRSVLAERYRRHDTLDVAVRWGDDVAQMGGPVPYLLACSWCASLYVAAGVAVVRRLAPLPWRHIAPVLTSSAVVGWLSERE